MSAPQPQTSPTSEPTPSRRRVAVRLGAVVALGLAAAFVAWLVLGRDDEAGTPTTPASITTLASGAPATTVARPALASTRQLRAAAVSSSVPVYWVGTRGGTQIELTRAPGGTFFVRYLPPGARAGDTRGFLTVATYPRANAYAEVQRAAAESKSKTIAVAGGGVAVYDPAHDTNVHIAYPGQAYQIEVFAPQPKVAVRLVESGAVRPVD